MAVGLVSQRRLGETPPRKAKLENRAPKNSHADHWQSRITRTPKILAVLIHVTFQETRVSTAEREPGAELPSP